MVTHALIEGWFYWIETGRGQELEMFMEDEIELLAPSQIKELIEARVVSPLGGVGFRPAKVANPKGGNRDSQRST